MQHCCNAVDDIDCLCRSLELNLAGFNCVLGINRPGYIMKWEKKYVVGEYVVCGWGNQLPPNYQTQLDIFLNCKQRYVGKAGK